MDVVACGLIEAGGSMSVYRNGAFLWCAPTTSLQGLAHNPAEQVWRNLRGSNVAGGPCACTATAPSCGARRERPTHAQLVCTACLQAAALARRPLDLPTCTRMWICR